MPKPYGTSPLILRLVYRKAVNMEIWKDVVGYEGKYQVSNMGRVKSLRMWSSVQRRYVSRERVLKQHKSLHGYLQIGLKTEGSRKLGLVHRLVAEAFIPNAENRREVNHINGIKTDNRVENLEWNTSHQNKVHAYANGLMKHSTRRVVQIDLRGNAIKEWESIKDAGLGTGAEVRNIGACCRGERKSAGGYIWRYKEAE